MYVCVCVCVCIHTHTYIHARTHTRAHTIYIYAYIYMHIHIYPRPRLTGTAKPDRRQRHWRRAARGNGGVERSFARFFRLRVLCVPYDCSRIVYGRFITYRSARANKDHHCIFGLQTTSHSPGPRVDPRGKTYTQDKGAQGQSENIASTIHIESRSGARVKSWRHQSDAIILPSAHRGRPEEHAQLLPEPALDGVEGQHPPSEAHTRVRTRHRRVTPRC